MKSVCIVGATSGIATEFARNAAQNGATLWLIARDVERLRSLASDLEARGAKSVRIFDFDLLDSDSRTRFLSEVIEEDFPELTLFAAGILPDEQRAAIDNQYAQEVFEVNFHVHVEFTQFILPIYKRRERGTLAYISSVAGDRGRAKNYFYGSTKAALSTYADGLRLSLENSGVKVFTIKPGFVETAMTSHLNLGPLAISSARAGASIYDGLKGGAKTVYVPWFWSPIMYTLKALPEIIFKRLPI